MSSVKAAFLPQDQKVIPSGQHDQQNPFDIPELFTLIGESMDPKTLVTSLQVSKRWHKILLPLVWLETTVCLLATTQKPSIKALKKHAYLIQKVDISEPIHSHSDASFPTCSNLRTLVLDWPPGHENRAWELLRRHRSTLQSVRLGCPTTSDIMETLYECPELKRLELSRLTLIKNDRWMGCFERLWSRLEVVSLVGSWYTPPWFQNQQHYRSPSEKTLQELATRVQKKSVKLREITITSGEEGVVNPAMLRSQFFVFQQSPDLTLIRWTPTLATGEDAGGEEKGNPLKLIADEIRRQGGDRIRWPRLETVEIPMAKIDPEDFGVLIRMMPRIVDLGFYGSTFNSDCWRRLSEGTPQHLNSIRVLNLGSCKKLSGSAVQEMLCSLPSLEKFKAWYIRDTDILNDNRAWVCRGTLRELTLAIRLETRSSQEMILSRVSELIQLRELYLWDLVRWENTPADQQLGLTLDKGLDQLRTLQRLQVLAGPTGPSGNTNWETEEMEWSRAPAEPNHYTRAREVDWLSRCTYPQQQAVNQATSRYGTPRAVEIVALRIQGEVAVETKVPPEILLLIVQHLKERGNFLACLRVSREWNRTLYPVVWREITLEWPLRQSRRYPSLETFQEHATLIRKLQIKGYRITNKSTSFLQCPNLKELVIDHEDDDPSTTSAHGLIHRHQQTLISLFVAQPFVTQELIDAMAGCPHLQTLEIRYLRLLKSRT
ncbi:hypothetical protein BGZ83_009910, partial [Gryganskiella cystojenkinii]